MKINRQAVHSRFGGRCAYCGQPIADSHRGYAGGPHIPEMAGRHGCPGEPEPIVPDV